MYKLRINPLARKDLLEIREYISKELDNPSAAEKTLTRIADSYGKLKDFPHIGIELSSKIDVVTDYRFLISGKYIIFYKVDDVYVSIYRILYGRRDYIKILLDEE
ncbi:MAG: type II toxin-antitoxin system RelE/ParE family toxin [Tissierellia bacterium]|nr:type II toxin-antitoxin system RelE/ParE family toxin [Tissierellia bacterium]